MCSCVLMIGAVTKRNLSILDPSIDRSFAFLGTLAIVGRTYPAAAGAALTNNNKWPINVFDTAFNTNNKQTRRRAYQ